MVLPRSKREEFRFTYQDYLLLPEGSRCELLDGEMCMTPAPNSDHQRVSKRLFELVAQLEKQGLGEVFYAPIDVMLSNEDVVQPDLLFISRPRLGMVKKEGIRGAPDFVIEILSPRAEERDRIIKRKLYGKFGVREYWIVDSEAQSVEVIVTSSKGFKTERVVTAPSKVSSVTFPSLVVDLESIFE